MKKDRRPFSEWVADEIEKDCARNDVERPGHEVKGSWEISPLREIHSKLSDEIREFQDAMFDYRYDPSEENRKALQWECSDVATTVMMLSANIDPEMSKLRCGR